MKHFHGKVAAITGAGSGIGRATAIELAKARCNLAISDVSERNLAETAEMLGRYPVKVTSHIVDVSRQEAVKRYASECVSQHGQVNMIINNAGVGLGETVEAMSYANFEWLMGINFWGVVFGSKEFLPYLKQSGDGHIVNISSVFGIIGVPTQSAYNAAKFAVRGFTEALREELDIENSGVSATCVHPGGVKTNIARSSRMGDMGALSLGSHDEISSMFERIARSTPEGAAKSILNGVRRNQRRVLIGADAAFLDVAQRLMPTGYQRILETAFRLNQRRSRIPAAS